MIAQLTLALLQLAAPEVDRTATTCAVEPLPSAAVVFHTPNGTATPMPLGGRWIINPAELDRITYDHFIARIDMTCTLIEPASWVKVSTETVATAGLIPPHSMSQPAPIEASSSTPIPDELAVPATPDTTIPVDAAPPAADVAGTPEPPAEVPATTTATTEITTTVVHVDDNKPTATITQAAPAHTTSAAHSTALRAIWAAGAATAGLVIGVGGWIIRATGGQP